MKHPILTGLLCALSTVLLLSAPARAEGVDADAAKALAKRNDCFKCHALDKTKKGPSYKQITAKYKDKADGETC
jgi:cytochrome c